MNSNDDFIISIEDEPNIEKDDFNIYCIERKYTHKEINIDENKVVKFISSEKTEKLYVIGIPSLVPKLQIRGNILGKISKEKKEKFDYSKCITTAQFIDHSDNNFSIQPEYLQNLEKSIYKCIFKPKHIYFIKNNNKIEKYETEFFSDINHEKVENFYAMLTDNELRNLDSRFELIQKIDKLPDNLNLRVFFESNELNELSKYYIEQKFFKNKVNDFDKLNTEYIELSKKLLSEIDSLNMVDEYYKQFKKKSSEIFTLQNSRSRSNSISNIDESKLSRTRPVTQEFIPRSNTVSPQKNKMSSNKSNDDIYEQISYKQLNEKISATYNAEESIQSTTIDIIGVYLKGQKLLYVEAKVFCELNLYALMLPAIFITAICSILSLILKDYSFGSTLIASLAAVNSFILSLITYLKLDAKAEAHKITAYSFEKLQSLCEFSSGRLLFMDKTVTPSELVENIATQVKDIKDKNQFILPEFIRYNFPRLYSTNVFAEVKRIQINEILLINQLKILINDGMLIHNKLKNDKDNIIFTEELNNNYNDQNKTFDDIIKFRTKYIDIDEKFKNEINDYINKKRKCNFCSLFPCLKT
jgi:hypothetical protein